MTFSAIIFFSQIFYWNILAVIAAAVICTIALSIRLVRDRYSIFHLSVCWILFFVVLVFGLVQAVSEENAHYDAWANTLRELTRSFAAATETMGHREITKETDANDPLCTHIRELYTAWCRDIPMSARIYTLRLHEKRSNKVDVVVSYPSEVNSDEKKQDALKGGGTYPPYGEWYNVYQRGFDGETSLDEIVRSSEYGEFVTVVTPLHDPNNPKYVEAILVADFRREQRKQLTGFVHSASVRHLTLLFSFYLVSLYFVTVIQQALRNAAKAKMELTAVKKAVNIAARAKNDFLANISREIRTPMNALVGFTEILSLRIYHSCTPQEREESEGILEIIRKSGKDLLTSINEILDFLKIEANLLQIDSVPFSIREIIKDVWDSKRELIVEKHLDFSVKYKEPVPEKILGDPVHLKQVLSNLVDNAVKFTEKGTITICCETSASEDSLPGMANPQKVKDSYLESTVLKIDVIDSGCGIPAEQIQQLFQPFAETDIPMPQQYGNIGLGLSVAQRLAQLMDGNITATSESGIGSTFTLTLHTYLPSEENDKLPPSVLAKGIVKKDSRIEPGLQVRAPEKPVPEELPPLHHILSEEQSLKNTRILVVEDMVINQMVIAAQLRSAGAKVEIAGNGELGIEKINQDTDNGLFFDAVLMDMQMPVMNGYDATRTLRQQGYTKPVIAVTAHALNGDREKTLAVGCDDYITKPVDRSLLIHTIQKYLNQ